jgi:hypothetical protein
MEYYKIKQNLRALSFLILILSFFTLISCDIFDQGDNIIPIEGDIIFSVKEDYEHYDSICEPSIILSMVTEKLYPVIGFLIEFEVKKMNSEIVIDFLGIWAPSGGADFWFPATAETILDIPDGEYLLELSYGGITDEYILIITNSYIKVTEVESHFTEFDINLFWRYSFNSFAYLCGTTEENLWICDDFLDTLLSMIELEEFHFPDSGDICYPCSTELHEYNMPARYFYYEDEWDYERVGRVFNYYKQNVLSQYPDVDIYLINWKNWRFHN